MVVIKIKDHPGWFRVVDDNQKENYIYVYEYPNGLSSKITIVPRNLMPLKHASHKYGIFTRSKKKNEYCGGSDNLSVAFEKADMKRNSMGGK